MIEKLLKATSAVKHTAETQKPIVVIDAGIATEENLKRITDRGFDYVCVSRSSLKKYTVAEDSVPVTVFDHRKRPIELVEVQTQII